MIELNPEFWVLEKGKDSHNSFSVQQVFGQITGQQLEQVIHHFGSFLAAKRWKTKLLVHVLDSKMLVSVNLRGLNSAFVFMS